MSHTVVPAPWGAGRHVVDGLSSESVLDTSHPIEVSILGPLEVRRAGAAIELPGRRHLQLLVSLVLDRGRPVATETLVDRLWGESPPSSATKTVQKYVWELRRVLGSEVGGFLATEGRGYVLRLDSEAVDAQRFESLVAAARQLPAAEAVEVLQEAEDLWRGSALEGFAHLDEARPTAMGLEELRLSATQRRLGLLLELERHLDALAELEQLTIEHPLREELWAHLMVARARSGRRNDALAAFQQIRHQLAHELGMEPSSRLRELEAKILDGSLALSEPDSGGGVGRAARLPYAVSTFVGRAQLLAQLEDELAVARLVTLTGPGGSGKTRLAIELARSLLPAYGERWFVDLSAIETPDHVLTATADALRLPKQPGTDVAVLVEEAIGDRKVVLILDNCEHVLDATAAVVGNLLASCSNLRVLATSRESLGLAGEHSWPVPPLDVPSGPDAAADVRHFEAVELFVARAREADPSFELDDRNKTAVIDICTRLDGLPLALELAAAQLRAMSAMDMADRIDDRMRVLGSSTRRPTRHATLQAAIDWSHALLTSAEQRVFEGISVFPGSFDLAAATAVVADEDIGHAAVVGLLGRLVQQSMVVKADDITGRGRYRVLETLRTYGREILADGEEVGHRRAAHARHFAQIAERIANPKPSDGDSWHAGLLADYHNLMAALEFAVEHDIELGAQLVYALSNLWSRTDQVVDGLRYVDPLLNRPDLSPPMRARVQCCAAELRSEHGEAVIAEREATEALATFESIRDEEGKTRAQFALGRALANSGHYEQGEALMKRAQGSFAATGSTRWASSTHALGSIRLSQGEYEEAEREFKEVLIWARRHGLAYTRAKAEWLLGVVALRRGRFTEARSLCDRAHAAFVDLDDRSAVAHVGVTLGDIARLAGDREAARKFYDAAYPALTDIGDRRCTASAMKNLADLERHRDARRAAELYMECLERRHLLGDRAGAAEALEGLACAFCDAADLTGAATMLGQAETIRRATGSIVPDAEQAVIAQVRVEVAAGLSPAEMAAAGSAGAGLPLDEAVVVARALVDGASAV